MMAVGGWKNSETTQQTNREDNRVMRRRNFEGKSHNEYESGYTIWSRERLTDPSRQTTPSKGRYFVTSRKKQPQSVIKRSD